VENTWNDCKIEDQQPNHFRIANPVRLPVKSPGKRAAKKCPRRCSSKASKPGWGSLTRRRRRSRQRWRSSIRIHDC
jgi:hypothetical protein